MCQFLMGVAKFTLTNLLLFSQKQPINTILYRDLILNTYSTGIPKETVNYCVKYVVPSIPQGNLSKYNFILCK